jgi:glycosyltransferase involved in cell wall biosynthesis
MHQNISLCIPTFNRFELVKKCIAKVKDDPRIDEIVLCDDASTDGSFEKLEEYAATVEKIKLYRNPTNRDCYANKREALKWATNDWCILFDSDNEIGTDYLDRLSNWANWNPDFAYLPVFAKPHFDYREFSGLMFSRDNVARYMGNGTFRCALNTANYFVNRQTYLTMWDPQVNPNTADSIYMNYRYLAHGKSLVFVPGLEYFHLVHEQSHYKLNCHKTGNFIDDVEKKLRALK